MPLYDGGREGFLAGDIDWDANVIKVVFVDGADYTPNYATHRFLSDVPAAGRVGTPQTLTGKTVTAGVADAADPTFTAVTGDQSEYVLIYQDTGVEGTSRLIGLITAGTNLPVTPNGGDIVLQFDNGANRIFKL